MALRELRNRALDLLVAGTTALAGANAYSQAPISQKPIIYQTWPHPDQIMQAQAQIQRRGLEFDLSFFEPGSYIAVIESTKRQTCEIVGGIYGGFRLNPSKPGQQIPNDKQITRWCITTDGDYCINVKGDGKCYQLGNAHLDARDVLKFIKLEKSVDIRDLPRVSPKDSYPTTPKKQAPTPADPRTRLQEKEIEDYISGVEDRLKRGRKLIDKLKGIMNPKEASKMELEFMDVENNLNRFILDYLKSKATSPNDSYPTTPKKQEPTPADPSKRPQAKDSSKEF